jgi:hypothetical protein
MKKRMPRQLNTKELDLIFDSEYRQMKKFEEESDPCDLYDNCRACPNWSQGGCGLGLHRQPLHDTDVRKEEGHIDVNFRYLNSLLNFFKI